MQITPFFLQQIIFVFSTCTGPLAAGIMGKDIPNFCLGGEAEQIAIKLAQTSDCE